MKATKAHQRMHHKAKHAVRHVTHSPHHKTKTAKGLKLFLGVACIVLAAVGVAIMAKTIAINRSADQLSAQAKEITTILSKAAVTSKLQHVQSTLGYGFAFDAAQFSATATALDATEQTYMNQDLATSRQYSSVTLTAKDTPDRHVSLLATAQPTLTFAASTGANYWASRMAQTKYQGVSKLDIATRENIATHVADANVTAATPVHLTLGKVPYTFIAYTHTNTAFGIPTVWQEFVYSTVQNDRPYTITIGPVTPQNTTAVAPLQHIISGISYAQTSPASVAQGSTKDGTVAGAATAADLPKATTKTPYDVDPDTILGVILRNQPAVVRVSSAYCADVDLLLKDGSVGITLPHTCAAGIGSGSIVSSDGYIATNGHVVTATPEEAVSGYPMMGSSQEQVFQRLTSVLRYMVTAKITTDEDVTKLLTAASKKDQDALMVLSTLGAHIPHELIRAQNGKTTYAVQTSTDPIKYNITNGTYRFSNTVLPAQLIGTNFNAKAMVAGTYNFGTSDASDVALLKIRGTYPVVRLGNIIHLEVGDGLTAIGYPGFTDGGLQTNKSQTPPTVTQGSVTAINSEIADVHKLIFTTVPIAQGNSGGPAFDKNGLQVALNTYSDIKCGDQECFGKGVARDIADFQVLLNDNRVTLKTASTISDEWNKGLTAYSEGNYRRAVKSFNTVATLYPAHYLARSMSELAVSKYNSPSDTSNGLWTHDHLVRAGWGMGATILAAGIGLISFLVYGSRKHGMVNAVPASMPSSQPIVPIITPTETWQTPQTPPNPNDYPPNSFNP